MISIGLVEDHAALRESLALVLEKEPDFEVVKQAESVKTLRGLPLPLFTNCREDVFSETRSLDSLIIPGHGHNRSNS